MEKMKVYGNYRTIPKGLVKKNLLQCRQAERQTQKQNKNLYTQNTHRVEEGVKKKSKV